MDRLPGRRDAQLEPPDAQVALVAARQHGVVTTAQLAAAGLTSTMVRTRVRNGQLHRVHRGVYAVGHPGLTDLGRVMAAVLACGDGAVVSHRSAADLWGIRRHRGLVEVTVPAGSVLQRPGVRVHRTRRLGPGDVTVLDGIPITTPRRTLTDLADVLTPSARERAVAAALRADLVRLEDLAPAPGRRRPSSAAPVFTRSQFERRFRAAVRRWGLPVPEMNQDLLGWEVDAYWPAHRLVVELDHPHTHLNARSFETDRIKQEQLEDAGIRVRRVTEARFRLRPGEVEQRLSRWLAAPP